MSVLALDISGIPRQWISHDDAITYHAKDAVAWSMGEIVAKYRGGFQTSGDQSYIETSSIIAVKGHGFNPYKHANVALTNRTLFGRDLGSNPSYGAPLIESCLRGLRALIRWLHCGTRVRIPYSLPHNKCVII